MVNEADLIYSLEINIIKEYQLGHFALLKVHVDIKLHREERSLAIDNRDVELLEFDTVVICEGETSYY
jgi:hypothetical protein